MSTNTRQARKQGFSEPSGVIELDLFGTPLKLVVRKTLRLKIHLRRKRGTLSIVFDFGNTFGFPWAVAIPVRSPKKKPEDITFGLRVAAAFITLGVCFGYVLKSVGLALA